MVVLQVVLLCLIGASILFYITGAVSTYRFFTCKRQESPTAHAGVSVLIPVCGLDNGASQNWESFCQQDLQNYEVLFGVMHPEDPSVPVLKNLVAKFPGRAKLFYGLPALGLNHQVSNLTHLIAAAQHDIIVLADSDIQIGPTYLRHVTAPLVDPKIGIITCGYLDHQPKVLGAAIAALGRGVEFIPSVLIARSLDDGLSFAIGPTIATRRTVLEQIGGLKTLVNRIGSDYHIGSRVATAGYRVELSTYLLQNDCGYESVLSVIRRELRWARTIRCNRGAQYFGLGMTYGTVYGVLLALLSGWQVWTILLCLAVLSVRFIQAAIIIRSLRCPQLFRWIWALPLRDLISLVIWIGGAFGHRIYWRGRHLRISADGIITEPQDNARRTASQAHAAHTSRLYSLLTRTLKSLFIWHL